MDHNLGEYTAMHIAGVGTAHDTIFLTKQQAQVLQEKCKISSHTVMIVYAFFVQIAESSGGRPYIVANTNCTADTLLPGTKQEMIEVAVSLEAAGHRCTKLNVAFVFPSE